MHSSNLAMNWLFYLMHSSDLFSLFTPIKVLLNNLELLVDHLKSCYAFFKVLFSALKVQLFQVLEIQIFQALEVELFSALEVQLFQALEVQIFQALEVQLFSALEVQLFSALEVQF